MSKEIETIDLDKSVKAAATVLAKRRNGCLVVVRDKIVAGIVTEQDIVSKVTASGVDPSKVLVRDVMSTPVISVEDTATLKEAAEKMSEYDIRRLIVVDRLGSLSGVITAEDLARWLAKQSNYDDVALNAIARVKKESSGGPYQSC
jgi:CBS domain-containing protein